MGRTEGRCGIKRGNEDNNRKRSDGIVRLDAVLSRWVDWWLCGKPGRELGPLCPSVVLSLCPGRRGDSWVKGEMCAAVKGSFAVGKEGRQSCWKVRPRGYEGAYVCVCGCTKV